MTLLLCLYIFYYYQFRFKILTNVYRKIVYALINIIISIKK